MNDDLSDLLATASINEARWTVYKLSADGGIRLGGDRHIHCVLVTEGVAWLHVSPGNSRPYAVEMTRGGLWLSFGGKVEIGNSEEKPQVEDEPPPSSDDVLTWRRAGKSATSALLIVGSFAVDSLRWGPVKRHLPENIHCPSETGEFPFWIGALGATKTLQLALTGQGARAFARRLGDTLITQMIREHEAASKLEPVDPEIGKLDRKIFAAARLINARPAFDWTVTRLAAAVGMSRSVFSEEFLSQLGEAPIRYLTHVRMTIACQMLRNPNVPIMEIAHQVGYSSNISLIRTFKRFYGVTPTAYREFQASANEDAAASFMPAHSAFVFNDDSTLVE